MKINRKTSKTEKRCGKSSLKKCLILILIVLFFEIFLFNFRHWESLFFTPVQECRLSLGLGLEPQSETEFLVKSEQDACIYLSGFNQHVDNFYVNATAEGMDKLPVSISAQDEANKYMLQMRDTTIVKGVSLTQYIRVHLSGITEKVKIQFKVPNGTKVILENFSINYRVPFQLSFARLLILSLIFIGLYFFRPGSNMYLLRLDWKDKRQKAIIIAAIGVHILVIAGIGEAILPDQAIPTQMQRGWPAYGQYTELADALIDGKVELERKPPASLANAENPYDGSERWQVVVEDAGENFDIDYAYFKGKYYSYFGVVPAVLFYVPYKLLTHTDLKTWDLVTICAMLYCIAAFGLIYQIAQKYFNKSSLAIYLLMSSLYIWGSAIVYLVYLGIVYSVPIICSLLFGTTGLACWVAASRSNGEKIKKVPLLVGSILIALVMGCRPQMSLIFLLAFPIFWKEIREDRAFFSIKGISNTLLVIVPFLIIGISLMFYNNARFGNPLDFGANYNLTSNDMTHRGFVLARLPLGIYEYLFQPITMSAEFPYLKVADIANDYMGYTNAEPLFGGFLAFNVIACINFGIFHLRNILRKYRVFAFAGMNLFLSIIIMLADIQMAGLTQRYMSDFGWLFILCSILIVMSVFMELQEHKNAYALEDSGGSLSLKVAEYFLIIGMVTGIFLNIWNIFITGRYFCLVDWNPQLFYTVKYLLPWS